jgi:DNA-directed RNA polymerase specialized sigma24 family protein
MFDATSALAERKRGPKPFFEGDRLALLLAYLEQPTSTLRGAADLFKCSESTVEKTLARVRRDAKEKAPVADTTGP